MMPGNAQTTTPALPQGEVTAPPQGEATAVVPETTATAAAGTETQQPPEQTTEKKTFTQEELDSIVSKRLAREQRKWEREQRSQQPPATNAPQGPLTLVDFETPEAYAEALAVHKARELIQQGAQQADEAEMLEAYADREEVAIEKYHDFKSVAYNPTLPVTDVMAQTIRATDNGPDVLYHLGLHPEEARRISRLPVYLQAAEIGRVSAKLVATPPVKKVSNAPAPVTPVTARSTPIAYDTTDPRSTETMSTSEWIAAERQRQARRLQAQLS